MLFIIEWTVWNFHVVNFANFLDQFLDQFHFYVRSVPIPIFKGVRSVPFPIFIS